MRRSSAEPERMPSEKRFRPASRKDVMDTKVLKVLREQMEKALRQIDAPGFVFTVGRCTYGEDNATFKVEVARKRSDGLVINRDASDFLRSAKWFGFTSDDLGKEFQANGKTYKLVGLASRKSKRPVLAADLSGQKFCFQVEGVLRAMGRHEQAKLYAERGYVDLGV